MHYFRRECDEEKKFKEVRTKKDQWCKCGRIPILRADSACLPDSFYHGAGSIIYFGRSDFPIWIQSVAERVFLGSIGGFQVAGGSRESLSCHDHADFSRYGDRLVAADYDRICPFQTRF